MPEGQAGTGGFAFPRFFRAGLEVDPSVEEPPETEEVSEPDSEEDDAEG